MSATNSADPALLAKVQKQIEYYFGDSNLPRDPFLKAEINKDPNGFVSIQTLLKFNRLASLTTDTSLIADSIKNSSLLALSDDGSSMKRVTPLPAVSLWKSRTVCVSGFPKCVKGDDHEPDIEEIEALFAPYGKVLSVKRRRAPVQEGADDENDKEGDGENVEEKEKVVEGEKKVLFTGSVFVEMESAEAASRVVVERLEWKKSDEDAAIELKVMSFKDHVLHERAARPTSGNNKKEKEVAEKDGDDGEKSAEEEEEEDGYEVGMLLCVENIGEGVRREDIKEKLEEYGAVAYVEFEQGGKSATVRFGEADVAEKVAGEMEKKKKEGENLMQLGGSEVEMRVLGGDEEKMYWMKLREMRKKRKMEAKNGGRGGRGGKRRFGGGGRGGRGGYKKRRN